jgi:hypothetical protein
MQHNLELELAHRAATEVKEDNKALKKALKSFLSLTRILKKSNKTLKRNCFEDEERI